MKKKNYLFVLFLLNLGIGLFSCNFGNNGGNVSNYQTLPAVVSYNMDLGGTTIGTTYGYCATPSLTTIASPGDCMILSFSIDYDNQPSTQYTTASDIIVNESVIQKPLEQTFDSVRISDYTLPISNVPGTSTSPFYNGKVFFTINCKDNSPNFRLVYNTQEPDSAGIKNLYLLAQPSSSSTIDVQKNYAFDVMYLIYNGQDTTIINSGSSGSTHFKYVKVNLKYFTGMSGTGQPVYKMVNDISSPLIFSIIQ